MNTREIMTGFNIALQQIDSCYAKLAKEHNLTFNALMFLYLIDGYEEITQTQACDWLFLPMSTVHSILKDFTSKGWVKVTKTAGKEKKISFTDKGRSSFSPVLEQTEHLESVLIGKLGEEKAVSLLRSAQEAAQVFSSLMEKQNA